MRPNQQEEKERRQFWEKILDCMFGKSRKDRSEYAEESLDELLKKLLGAIPEVKSVTNGSVERHPIVSNLPQGTDENRITSMAAALLSLSERAIIEMEKGDFDQLYIKGSKGYLMISQDGPNVSLSVSKNVNGRDDKYYNKHDDDSSEMSAGLVDM